ncbi:F17 fimbrial protein precursor [Pseudomonas sp. M47T1]|uniref:fimbrial protein n=1 Tax=unclassified Pseudomonas TaxID=196821 RepID=UPI000260755F|nr:fimbrial protein [Pseudomonas sp. M47T1]EIK97090.1 F17 fimbrial protein precursor [Pseudomonas sp. M47T1]
MKLYPSALITGLCGLLAMPAAMAADGTIDFLGRIIGPTCDINDGNPSFNVELPTVSTTALSVVGKSAGRQPFQIRLTGCVPETGRVMTYFEPGPTINPRTGRLITNTGVGQAGNVEVGLLNNQQRTMDLREGPGFQDSQVVDITAGNAYLDYFAEYMPVGSVTPGDVRTQVRYSIVHY